ncbi:ATP-binding protein [Oecophyllibacter saccharovorans]|uniref:ATP-dependent nuclease n=1 Tax=Oecophyllibacter saccharovorans TaxID=2558360 RepID=UPI001143F2AB|nr:ATP-binding protein [Oecophyllibacter saccharovorans]QDH15578.1 ATP-binding protein [Oecophyllibacter saccharovorans]
MLIEEVKLRFGAGPGSEPLVLDAPAVTIFVGPNNSGKSLLLREIANFCRTGQSSGTILDGLKFRKRSDEEIDKNLEALRDNKRNSGEGNEPNQEFLYFEGGRAPIRALDYRQSQQNPNEHLTVFAPYCVAPYVLLLDGPGRIDLTKAQKRGDLKDPKSTFAKLLMDDTGRKTLREILYDALDLYLGMDDSVNGSIHLRYGGTPPPNEHQLEGDTLKWMENTTPIQECGDGVKAFTGMLLALHTGDSKVMLIDEPEAFLHPPLAHKLGREVAKAASQSGKQVFVSTHSSHFLMGAIQSGAEVNVVRLTYQPASATQPETATARTLSNDAMHTMIYEPLLRSANALSGLFYEGILVTEADADRAFYQEINERLLEKDPKRGAANTLFLNANGKDSVYKIVGPFRKLGIPVAAILDIDALNPRTNFTPLLRGANYPEPHKDINEERKNIWSSLKSGGQNPKSNGGIALLEGDAKKRAEALFDDLDQYGLFVLRHGEVEHWLRKLEVPRSKKGWLYNIFKALGSDPEDPAYVHPADNDVWAFLDKVGAWIKNRDRRGIPGAQRKEPDVTPPKP